MTKDKVVLCALALALAASAVPAAAQLRRIEVGGTAREYRVHLPAGTAAGSPDALLIVLHGGGGTPAGMAAHTRFDRLADREGFIVAYPAALNGRWSDGRSAEGDEDVRFLQALADSLRRRHRLAPDRVFALGISNGAMMAYRLACERPDAVAAIGVVAGAMPARLRNACAGTRPISVVALNGTDDRLVPFDGSPRLLSVPASLAFWAARAGCDTPGDMAVIDRIRDGTRIRHTAFRNCRGAAIELYVIEGGGHTWPGGPRVQLPRLGRTTRELDASAVLWRFFDTPAGAHGRSIGSPTPLPHSVHDPS